MMETAHKVEFTLAVEFTYYGDEMDYCETFKEIIERARELASVEIVGEVKRTPFAVGNS